MPSPGPARHPFRARIPFMPVKWTISHADRLGIAVARDRVTVSDKTHEPDFAPIRL